MTTKDSWRYLTLAEAKSLECNRCGDCCSSTSDLTKDENSWFHWGTLPKHQYRGMGKGKPLIIPLELVGGVYQDREWRDGDQRNETTDVAFRCSQFSRDGDGLASCGLHDAKRPRPCGQFPLDYPHIAKQLTEGRYIKSRAAQFKRCTWYGVMLIPEESWLLDWRDPDGTLRWDELSTEQQILVYHYLGMPLLTPEQPGMLMTTEVEVEVGAE